MSAAGVLTEPMTMSEYGSEAKMESGAGVVAAFVEQRDGSIRATAHEVVGAAAELARAMGGKVHALAAGGPGLGAACGQLGGRGAEVIRVAEGAGLAQYHAERYAHIVAGMVAGGGYQAVLFPASALGADLAPRVAALLDVPLASDATGLEVVDGGLVATRPVYGGKAFARVAFDASPAVVSLRPHVFPPGTRPAAGRVEVFTPAGGAPAGGRAVDFRAASGGSVDVAEAEIVVSGGRGLRGPENWGVIEDVRDALGPTAALGASRAVVDAGWRPHGEQVGQTGKTIAPKLYFALAISGAIQHLAGMRTARTIVAVNKDADAPIFNVADYGIVGDVFEVAPVLAAEIRRLKSQSG
ncbi:MAG: electron transfer flavoprotein subunit alpha/FixB family protein [Gammaproteobacteria bacterium]|nr:electron transfer flavoprotein subunit alpha/FixB family protein [Gammaproteobacteria bacterium]MDE0649473.1 electron transfer flavoprotein subunit alpha/FixB family protein [Gammaproteobacteria bacterium]